jgi:hypothetical protein
MRLPSILHQVVLEQGDSATEGKPGEAWRAIFLANALSVWRAILLIELNTMTTVFGPIDLHWISL